jgi:hypothetical protein
MGSNCDCNGYGNHPQAQGLQIFVKEYADYGYKSDKPVCTFSNDNCID